MEHASNGSHFPPPPTISPAIPPYVKLGLTIAYTIFYSLLFAFVYAQLWLVLRYRHKRFSYQTAFLFLCLLWAALRALLFSFYFRDCVTANALGPFAFWLLYCFPVCLQFFTLSLMNLYCAQVSRLLVLLVLLVTLGTDPSRSMLRLIGDSKLSLGLTVNLQPQSAGID
uniref:G protein-coupled receptor 137B n=1 Tax=Acanthochromis polyacanthus TaxID=80966 RepID=A0A3Q1G4Y4_9TELE